MSTWRRFSNVVGGGAAALLATTAIALAQGNPMVTQDDATHTATLEGVTAYFMVDPQNNTVRWSIDVGETDITGATIACAPADDAGPAQGPAPTPAAGETPAPAGGATPAPAGGATPAPAEGATPAPAGGATPAPAEGATPAPAGGAQQPGGNIGGNEGTTTGMTAPITPVQGGDAAAAGEIDTTNGAVALDLLEGADVTMTEGRIEGQHADLDADLFDQITAGACWIDIQTANADAAPAAPAGQAPAAPAGQTPTPAPATPTPATPAPAPGG